MLGNVSGILNLVVFVFLITFLAAIFAVQMFRGEIPQIGTDGNPIRVTFYNIYNSFLGMYQVLSSEGWTSILYNVTQYMDGYGTAWVGATFFVLWFILANCRYQSLAVFRAHANPIQSSSSTCLLPSSKRTSMFLRTRSACSRSGHSCSRRSWEILRMGKFQ